MNATIKRLISAGQVKPGQKAFAVERPGEPALEVERYGAAHDVLLFAGWRPCSARMGDRVGDVMEWHKDGEVTLDFLRANLAEKRAALRLAQLDFEAAEQVLRVAEQQINTAFSADQVQA